MSERSKENTAPQGARKGGGRTIMTGLLLLPVIAVLMPSCIVLAVGMLPTIVAYVVDRTAGKYLTITVALLNFCGTLPGLRDLWLMRQAYGEAARIAADPLHWLTSYGAAALGWIVYLAVPVILSMYYSGVTAHRMEGLKRAQANLVESWGPAVTPQGQRGPAEDQ